MGVSASKVKTKPFGTVGIRLEFDTAFLEVVD